MPPKEAPIAWLLIASKRKLVLGFFLSQVMVAGCMATQLKPHQWEGVKFLWRNIVLDFEVCKLCHFYSGLITALLRIHQDMWPQRQSGTLAWLLNFVELNQVLYELHFC